MNNIEVLCLEGLEDACIGYQVVLRGAAPVLVYDYAKTIAVLRASGYADDDIQEFLEEITQVDYINPPIFVNFNNEMANYIAGGDRYYFDDDDISEYTLH